MHLGKVREQFSEVVFGDCAVAFGERLREVIGRQSDRVPLEVAATEVETVDTQGGEPCGERVDLAQIGRASCRERV